MIASTGGRALLKNTNRWRETGGFTTKTESGGNYCGYRSRVKSSPSGGKLPHPDRVSQAFPIRC